MRCCLVILTPSHTSLTTSQPHKNRRDKRGEKRAPRGKDRAICFLEFNLGAAIVARCGVRYVCACGLKCQTALYTARYNCTHTPIESSKRACQLGMAGCLHIYTGLALCTQRLRTHVHACVTHHIPK